MKIHKLNPALADYQFMPRVALKGTKTKFYARGLDSKSAFTPGKTYIVRVIPLEETATARTLAIGDEGGCYDELSVTADEQGRLSFSYTFQKEELYTLRFINNKNERLIDFKVFCMEEDLYRRIPMRGNTHCHSCFSWDGHEDPVIVASLYRKAGFDYLAITDHHKIDGSKYAVEQIRGIPTEMALYYGEEVHVPNAYIHVINVGALLEGGIGVDKWYHDHEEQVNREVDSIAESVKGTLPEGVEPYDFAWRKWIADIIHKNGGIAIIAHPFWEYDANNTPNAMLKYLIENHIYDAMEVIHGQECMDLSEANRQVAYWNELRSQGLFIPVVGADDAHRRNFPLNYSGDFNRCCTIIFAKDTSFDGFAEAVKNGYSVAVENYTDIGAEHVIGTYRLTMYALFLLEQYFPFHDELCFEEGCRIKDAYLGDEESMKILELIKGRVERYRKCFFGQE